MRDFIKDFGPLIGPTLGFMFGLLAIVAHQKINSLLTRRRIHIEVAEIGTLLRRARQPLDRYTMERVTTTLDGVEHTGGRTADGAQSVMSLNHIELVFVGVKGRLDSIKEKVFASGNVNLIERYSRMQWLVDRISVRVAKLERGEDLPTEDFGVIRSLWNRLLKECEDKTPAIGVKS